MTILSPLQIAAASALVARLQYQTGKAQDEALTFPEDVAQQVAEAGEDRVNGAQCIRDVLATLYDQRRDGHRRQALAEFQAQQTANAARAVLERETECNPAQSYEAVSRLNDAERETLAGLFDTSDCKANAEQVLTDAEARIIREAQEAEAARVAAEEAAKLAAEEAEKKAAEEAAAAKLAEEEAAKKAAEEAEAAETPAPATDAEPATVVEPAAEAAE